MNERSIFLAALEIADPAARAAYLDEACGGDAAARRGVEELLAANARSGTFMPAPAGGEATGEWAKGEAPGTRVGPYKLLQLIGEGGMGAVYMAEQEEPIRRMVAVKIIRAGLDSRAVLARFEAERQALAMMDHPNIARVLDTGTTDSGRPYFVMELVKGVPVTKFCDEHQLTLRERLELFVPICQAIQHAHQKGVIHRDIKPSNVLVALYDDKPVPKVIDFGVAKATHQKLTEKTLFTAFGSVVGTLEYMSPEQAKLNQLDIDTRSDVYGLGVLLYELLTGTTPLESARLKSAAFDEVLRLIREEEPPRPSARLSTASTRPAIAAARRVEPAQLGKLLTGELDWIVLKALEKDRTRRYETANGLARDIQRYLSDEAVEACPPTLGYKLRKAYRKNRAAVGVAAGFLVVLAVAAAVSTALAIQARRSERMAVAAQQRAEEEKQTAQAVRDFLQKDLLLQASLFEQAETVRLSGSESAVKPNPTVNELLDRAAAQLTPEKIEAKFPKLPSIQADVLKTVGDAYYALRQDKKALELLTRAIELYRTSRGTDDPATLSARYKVGLIYLSLGRLDEAQALFGSVRNDQVRVCGPHHRDTFLTRMGLGYVCSFKKRPDEAVAIFKQLRDDGRTHFGPDDRDTMSAAGNLAVSLREAGRVKEAVRELELIRDAFRRLQIRPDHPGFQAMIDGLALAYNKDGRKQEALALHEEALADWERIGDPLNPATWLFRHQMTWWNYMETGQEAAAIPHFEKNLTAAGNIGQQVTTRESLSEAYLRTGRVEDALSQVQKSFEAQVKHYGPEHRSWATGRARTRIGAALVRLKKYGEAEPWLVEGYQELLEHVVQRPAYDGQTIPIARSAIAELYKSTNKPDELAKWEEQHLQRLLAEAPLNHLEIRNTTQSLTPAYAAAGQYDKAAQTIERVLAKTSDERLFDPLSGTLVNLYQALDRLDEVSKWSARRIPLVKQNLHKAQAAAANPTALRNAAHMLTWAYAHSDHRAEAVQQFDTTINPYKSKGWPHDKVAVNSIASICRAVARAGDPERGIEVTNSILAELGQLPNPPQDVIAAQLYTLGFLLSQAGRHNEAEPHLRKALEFHDRIEPELWSTSRTRLYLATALLAQKKYTQAEPLLLACHAEMSQRIGTAPLWEKQFLAHSADRLIELYTALDKPAEVATWRTERAKSIGNLEP